MKTAAILVRLLLSLRHMRVSQPMRRLHERLDGPCDKDYGVPNVLTGPIT